MSKKICPYEIYVSAYLDNELSPLDKQLIRNHLDYCPECHKVAEDIIAVGKYTTFCRKNFPEVDLTARVQKKIAEQKSPVKISIPVWQSYLYKLGLAISMLFFVLTPKAFSRVEAAVFAGYILGHLIIYTDDLLKREKIFSRLELCP